jgi:hypothetical protein
MESQRDRRGRYVGKTRVPPVEDSKAFVIVELDRRTGLVTVDDEFSTPMETWAMLDWATEAYGRQLEALHGSD